MADEANTPVATGRIRFENISSRAYEHPADRGALASARAVPGFPAVLKVISAEFIERSERLYALASMVKVSERQYPELHRLRVECSTVLDLEKAPDVFVARDPYPNVYALGWDEPFLVITTGMLDLVDGDGLRFVVGQGVGHALSGHALYYTMLVRLTELALRMSWLPVGGLGLRAIVVALQDWYRRAQLSADRAGLLCVQDAGVALRVHMAMAGVTDPSQVDTTEFLQQAKDYEAVEDVRDSVFKLVHLLGQTHPLPVVRAADLQRWAASEQYRAILAGDYPRRDEDKPASNWKDDVKGAAKSYKDAVASSADPLAKVFSEVGSALSGTASKLWQGFTGGSGGNTPPPTDNKN